MRKQALLIAILVITFIQGYSQVPASMPANAYRPPITIFGPNNPDMAFVGTADLQDQFVSRTWTAGKVKFKNGQQWENVLLLFDVHSNKLYYLHENTPMEFTFPVDEFLIGLIVAKDTLGMVFRSSYPSINNHTSETFYEVLVDGKIQLLKCRAKNVGLYKDTDQPEQKRFTEKEQLYVYVDGEMVKIRKDKEDILKALPKYAKKIEAIQDDLRLKLKNEEGLMKLFFELNKI
jgi:hypothetical protein